MPAALGGAVQPWADRDPVGPDVQPGGHPPGLVAGAVPAAVADRVAGILRAWGEEAPCLLVLDDLHAADEDSLAVLANLARRLPQLRCAMVAAARARPPDLSVALDALVERLGQAGTAVVWDLQPLGVEDTTRLAAHWLRASPDAALAARLWESSLGNPFYLGQAIRSLQEAFPAGPSSDAGSFVPTLASASPVRARLARLGDTAERTAMTLSVFPTVAVHDLPVVADLVGVPLDAAGHAFDLLVAAGFVDQRPGGRFRFSHPIVGDTLRAQLGPAERRRLHGRIARWLGDRRAAGAPVSVLELAHHVAGSATPGDRVAAAVLAEAGDATLQEAPLAAAGWFRAALELLAASAAERPAMLTRLAQALYRAGAVEELAAASGEMLEVLPPGPDRDWIAAVAMAMLAFKHRRTDALALADRVLAGHDVPMPSVLAEKARALAYLGRCDEAAELATRVLGLADSIHSPGVGVSASALVDVAYYRGQVAECEALLARAATVIGSEPTPDRRALLCRWATVRASYGQLIQARAMTAEAEDIHAELGGAIQPVATILRTARVVTAWLDGSWDDLLDELERPPEGGPDDSEVVGILAAAVHAQRGDRPQAMRILHQSGPEGSFPTLRAWVRAQAAPAGGDAAGARQLLVAAIDDAQRTGLWGFAHFGLALLVELELAAGRTAAARARLATLEWRAETMAIPVATVLALRTRGLVTAQAGPLREALTMATAHGLTMEAALARLQLAALDEAPAEHLRAAFTAFRAAGAERWRRRAAAELRTRGIPVPRQPRRAPGALTETETLLARYVADGWTNREIAEAMSLSIGTVSTYLSRVLARTGTANRRELGRAVRKGIVGQGRPS